MAQQDLLATLIYSKPPIQRWAMEAHSILRETLSLMEPIAMFTEWSKEESTVLGELSTACFRSTFSALLLIEQECLWDTEVIMRSVMEGTVKFIYLLFEPEAFSERFDEYAHQLFDIALLRNHNKAQEALDSLPNPMEQEWRPIRDLLLPERELQDYRTMYSPKMRRALENKWGFTNLVKELACSKRYSNAPAGLGMFLHGYNIASHLQHMDAQGTAIVMEREFRSEERKRAIHLAHAARMASDLIHCTLLRLWVGYEFIQSETAPLHAFYEGLTPFLEELHSAQALWAEIEYPTSS